MFSKIAKTKKGMSLIEVMVAVAVFLFVSVAVYEAYAGLLALVSLSRVKITATNLANEQFEIVKNISYDDVGVVAGVPNGVITPVQNLSRDGKDFVVTTTVRNVDDPADGTLGGSPNDTSPADYKLIEVEVACPICKNFTPIILNARVAPKSLEAASTNGSLFIHVFDASGFPVSGATVHVVNNAVLPAVDITDVTDVNGLLQIVDTIPSNESYEITVSKTGYSTERTYPSGDVGNPNPSKPHATVAVQTVTDISFAIDRLSTIEFSTIRNNCSAVSGVDYHINGAKLLGTAPDILKYEADLTTNGSGSSIISNLEWDVYSINLTDPAFYLAGTISPLPINLSPNSTQNASIVLSDVIPNALLVSVKDSSTGLPLSGADVTLSDLGGFSEMRVTGRGFIRQTDWSGGSGVDNGSDNTTTFFSEDGNVEYALPAGVLKLEQTLGLHASSAVLESSTFDTGDVATFFDITWSPESQPIETGIDSVKIQVATSNDDEGPWNFTGPDGTSGTYYTTSDQNIHSSNNGNRYLRYKVFLSTDDQLATPTVSDVAFTFTSDCAPPGQVLFTGLSAGSDYQIDIQKTGYQSETQPLVIGAGWQSYDLPLLSE